MPDFAMCSNSECPNTKTCRRHPDSGTVPDPIRQCWGTFNWRQCNAYWMLTMDSIREKRERGEIPV